MNFESLLRLYRTQDGVLSHNAGESARDFAFPGSALYGLLHAWVGIQRADVDLVSPDYIDRTCEANRHFVRVYAIRKPLRSALRWESLPAPAAIAAKSQPWSKA